MGSLGECDRWPVGWVEAQNPIFAWVRLSLTTTTNKSPCSAIAHNQLLIRTLLAVMTTIFLGFVINLGYE
ncbi:MAG: hypothetical protein ACYTXC_04340 [Nostoc sp.]